MVQNATGTGPAGGAGKVDGRSEPVGEGEGGKGKGGRSPPRVRLDGFFVVVVVGVAIVAFGECGVSFGECGVVCGEALDVLGDGGRAAVEVVGQVGDLL